LEVYLNIAEWGDGLYGIEAAARKHFGKAVLPNPREWSPAAPTSYIAGRGRRVSQLGALLACVGKG
jgi:monofunctional biosynthetic peptidoglycan transglycosylase